ncbi:hypothetical protein SAMN02745146_1294 [Hymenobacter daecheongensis DSM 21074]|uniref:Tetratricopeptide repeat-containing protein n=1 Tax=Hymenobacter daecheongensis DSM 21074 TaxID=1121955 RepID=A0A1M6CX06_9BACT|nr:hypothetical protein [Hymenobacter daecheongensis]SHI65278.1 hypothetical protein SAMN02745146_1294 [Hymenobacter daecheongensis DSM 21074]
MEKLSNLAKIVTDRRLKEAPLFDFSARAAKHKDYQLIQLLEADPDSTQLQLTKGLYGKASPASLITFRKLKSRVQQKLLNHLYFLDQADPRHLVSRRYELQCLSLYHQVTVLYGEGEYALAEQLLRKCLRQALDGEFTQYAVLAARLLCTLYADLRQPARYKAMSTQLLKYQQLLLLEDEAGQIYGSSKLALAHTVRTRRTLLNEIPAYQEKLQRLHDKAKSFTTFNYLYLIRLTQQELTGNYAEIIRLTSATARQAAQGKLNRKRFDKRFNNYMNAYAHLRSKQAEKGLALAEEYFKDFHPSSGNWFFFLENYVLLALHAGQYGKALQLLELALKNPYFRKQRVAARQRWDLFRAYIHFVQPEVSPLRLRHFNQFVQTLPDYSRDKQGYNVAILILQFLHYLRQQDVDGLLSRLEGLRKYERRHLRDAATLRSQLFFRLLVLTVKEHFNPQACEKKAQPLLKRLREAPQPGEAFAEIEIIPYEALWQLALDILAANAAREQAREVAARQRVG